MKTLFTNMFLLSLSFSIFSYSQQKNDSYFPLDVGNEWQFESNLFPHSESITDTARINGILYYVLSTEGIEPYLLFRESENKVFVLDLTDTTEVLLFNFDAEIDESWELTDNFNCFFGLEVVLISKNDTVETPIGTLYDCFHFRHSQNCADAGIYDTWFAKGIGKIRFMEVFIMGMGDFILEEYRVITSVNQPEIPDNISYGLFQNYPNPFNPKTKIGFRIANFGFVSLKVYDVLGREVANLVNEEKSPGEYDVEFDASQLSSGIYFYKLQTESYSLTKKMIYLK